MLSIDPARQGHGLGRQLIAAAEAHCRNAGCREMELEVVNLRTELAALLPAIRLRRDRHAPVPGSRAGQAPLPLHRDDEVPAAGRLSTGPGSGRDLVAASEPVDREFSDARFARVRPDAIQLWSLSRDESHLDHKHCRRMDGCSALDDCVCGEYCWPVRSSFRHGCRHGPEPARPPRRRQPTTTACRPICGPLLAAPESELRLVTQRYNTDRATLNGNYDGGRGPGRGGRGGDGRGGRGTDAAPAAPHRRRSRSRPTGSRG